MIRRRGNTSTQQLASRWECMQNQSNSPMGTCLLLRNPEVYLRAIPRVNFPNRRRFITSISPISVMVNLVCGYGRTGVARNVGDMNRVDQMRRGRSYLVILTGEDCGYSPYSWHRCLLKCSRPYFSDDDGDGTAGRTVSEIYSEVFRPEDQTRRGEYLKMVEETDDHRRMVDLALRIDREESSGRD